MRRILTVLLVLALLCPAVPTVSAEEITEMSGVDSEECVFYGDMIVVDCEEWVSLRAEPSTSADRVATVPLGATVTNCAWYDGDFISCEYNGESGYILAWYLETPKSPYGDLILEYSLHGCTVNAYREYSDSSELVYVECLDESGAIVWTHRSFVPFTTELTCADAFIGGTAEAPAVIVFNADKGLYALDFYTGEECWLLPNETAALGGGVCHAVAADGTIYIGGYYGPDPVAISAAGELLWESEARHDAYWMYEIEVTDEGVVATYDCIDEHEAAGRICYGFDGSMLWVEWF